MRAPAYSPQRLAAMSDDVLSGDTLVLLDEVVSTNALARERASAGAPGGLLVVAENQSAGRGRGGKTWVSPPGVGIWTSLLLRPRLPLDRLGLIPLAAAVAAAEAIEALHELSVRLKWPNDLVCGGRKLGGVLIESTTQGDRLAWVVVGIGINVVATRDDFPEEIRETATSLLLAGACDCDRERLLVGLYRGVHDRLGRLETEGPAPLLAAYARRDATAGRRIVFEISAGERITGISGGIDEQGALIIETEDGRRSFRDGAITEFGSC